MNNTRESPPLNLNNLSIQVVEAFLLPNKN
jgi:hypothetical protein